MQAALIVRQLYNCGPWQPKQFKYKQVSSSCDSCLLHHMTLSYHCGNSRRKTALAEPGTEQICVLRIFTPDTLEDTEGAGWDVTKTLRHSPAVELQTVVHGVSSWCRVPLTPGLTWDSKKDIEHQFLKHTGPWAREGMF